MTMGPHVVGQGFEYLLRSVLQVVGRAGMCTGRATALAEVVSVRATM